MSEVLLPTWIVPEEETHEWLDEGSSVFPSAFAPGIAQRQSYGGLRLKMSRRHTVRGEEKAQLLSILQATRGRYNALRTKVHFALRGSGLGAEIIENNTFANGTTSWTTGTFTSLSVADRILRVSKLQTASNNELYSPANTVVQYAPHVARIQVTAGRRSTSFSYAFGAGSTNSGFEYGSTASQAAGILRHTFTPYTTTAYVALQDSAASGQYAGDYVDVPYESLSRCPLVDNGTNSLLQSDEFDTTWTTTRLSVDDQTGSTADPIGTNVADSLIEDSSAGTHFVQQNLTIASTALDYSFGVALKAGSRTWVQIILQENSGTTAAAAYFNLSTGAAGTVSTGANWASTRAFTVALGNNWYACYVVARKTNAATSLSAIIALATADNTNSYTGNGSGNIYAWRATIAQSSVPTRLIQTTTTASTGTSQTGNALYVKGLPASTSGLLLPGDYFEINGEIKQATAALNSDAAGLGYLQFEPALVRSPADNDPVIVIDPMGKFLVSNIKVDNRFGTDAIVTYDLEHIYE